MIFGCVLLLNQRVFLSMFFSTVHVYNLAQYQTANHSHLSNVEALILSPSLCLSTLAPVAWSGLRVSLPKLQRPTPASAGRVAACREHILESQELKQNKQVTRSDTTLAQPASC
jgi:hypothetical protein